MFNKDFIKKALPYISAAIAFLLIICVYFLPVLEGKILSQQDTTSFVCTSHEVVDHLEKTGHSSFWTNSLFCGMPTYQIAAQIPSASTLRPVEKMMLLGLPELLTYCRFNSYYFFFLFFHYHRSRTQYQSHYHSRYGRCNRWFYANDETKVLLGHGFDHVFYRID